MPALSFVDPASSTAKFVNVGANGHSNLPQNLHTLGSGGTTSTANVEGRILSTDLRFVGNLSNPDIVLELLFPQLAQLPE